MAVINYVSKCKKKSFKFKFEIPFILPITQTEHFNYCTHIWGENTYNEITYTFPKQ